MLTCGNTLGESFSNYYICHVKNKVFEEVKTPKIYMCHILDIFILDEDKKKENITNVHLKKNISLNFTYKLSKKINIRHSCII